MLPRFRRRGKVLEKIKPPSIFRWGVLLRLWGCIRTGKNELVRMVPATRPCPRRRGSGFNKEETLLNLIPVTPRRSWQQGCNRLRRETLPARYRRRNPFTSRQSHASVGNYVSPWPVLAGGQRADAVHRRFRGLKQRGIVSADHFDLQALGDVTGECPVRKPRQIYILNRPLLENKIVKGRERTLVSDGSEPSKTYVIHVDNEHPSI